MNKPMGQIVIRNIDAAVLDALRRRAAASGISMEEQARRALTKAVGLERETAACRLAELRRVIGRLEGPSSLADLRRDRARDSE
jgi:plasmid stability protein